MRRLAIAIVLVATVLATAPAADAAGRRVPKGFYGAMWDRAVADSSDADQETQWALMARSGVESVRTVFNWASAQPDAGSAPDFAYTDRLVALSARHNINLLPTVRGTPAWAARDPAAGGATPKRVSDYTAYLRALVLRYGPKGSFWTAHRELHKRPLREWQIWNEPHFAYYWNTDGRGRNAWAPEYASLLKASARTVKGLDPGAKIVLAGLADFAWLHLDRLNRFGIRRYYDIASLNLFTGKPDLVMKGLGLFRRALRHGGAARRPVWLTETTWPAGVGRVPVPQVAWQRAWYTTDAGMASRLRGLYSLAVRNRRKLRLGRVYWYTWASAYSDGDLFDYTGLLHFAGGVVERRPALDAYGASARRDEGCTKTPAGACAR